MKLKVRIVKAKRFLEVDTQKLPDRAYKEALILGLQQLLSRGMLKVKRDPDNGYDREQIMEIVRVNLADLEQDKFRSHQDFWNYIDKMENKAHETPPSS